MYNHVVLVGRLVADPQYRPLNEGRGVCNFTLAVDRPTSSGETDFLDVVAFGSLAEIVHKYLRKGRLVLVEGSLRTRIWERNDGTRVKVYEIYARDVRMLDKPKREGKTAKPSPASSSNLGEEPDDFEEIVDLPF